MKIAVINGPNMNMLGVREPELYGSGTYAQLCEAIAAEAARLGAEVSFCQSNHEGVLIDAIQQAAEQADGIIINAAAYTHTSIALADALKAAGLPAVEVHITDPDQREPYRRVSYIREACVACIKGKGFPGYLEALRLLVEK